ncbi:MULTISPECIES: hypothetical protein [Vibrio]|uniref:hypothetical protein n=1 Tax=Vibrio TaxID=662 RepID=UPI000841D7B2|nr:MULTISPECIES: hypothetical protein [Vibrio]ODM57014.1 hypothetical protein BC455_18150 [Vibrio harveyi]USD58643.1 hypothetical protein J4N44_27200 [Vibrio sp. SCSIO 43155]
MLDEIKALVEDHSITIVTGPACSGKTWLISNFRDESYLIDNKSEAISSGNGSISLSQFLEASTTNKKFVAIDEAQLIKGHQLIELAKLLLDRGQKVIIACQTVEFIPILELVGFCEHMNDVSIAHIALDGWDDSTAHPTSFKLWPLISK